MNDDAARNTCKLLRWVERMDQVISECEAQPDDIECVRMASVMREYRDLEIDRARAMPGATVDCAA